MTLIIFFFLEMVFCMCIFPINMVNTQLISRPEKVCIFMITKKTYLVSSL